MYRSDTEIKRITTGLLKQSLPKTSWTHAAHFAAAMQLIQIRGYESTKADMPEIIRGYNFSVGVENSDSDGYHHTITLASLAAARHVFTPHENEAPLFEIVNRLLSGPFAHPNWLLKYWSEDILFSIKARRRWTEPNIKPLPFDL